MPKKGLSKKDLSTLKGRMENQYGEGTIEITIIVKTQEDLEERLSQITEQIITMNKDVYQVSHKAKKRICDIIKFPERG